MSKLAKAFAQEPKKFNSTSGWLKLKQGSHTLRLCPRWNDETIEVDGEKVSIPYRTAEQHPMFTKGDKKYVPQCLDFIFNDENLTKKAYLAGVISKEDYDKWEITGCPMCVIANALLQVREADSRKNKTAKKDDKDFQKFISSKRYYYNILVRPENKVYMAGKSQEFQDTISAAVAGPYPDLFDAKNGHDFQTNATNEGQQRRYSPPMIFPKGTPLNMAKGEKLYDLDDAVIGGIRTYDELVDLIMTNHTIIVQRSGVDLNQFTNFNGSKKTSKPAAAKAKAKKKK